MEACWESPFFVCLFVVQLHAHLPPERMQSIEGKVRMLLNENRKLLVEQADQEIPYGEEKRFCDETSKNIHPKCKAAAGRMMCIRGRFPSWLTIHIDNQCNSPPTYPGTHLCLLQVFI